MSDLPEHARRNRDEWTSWAPDYAQEAPRAWAAEEITWGVWGVPEAELRVLPESVEGLDVMQERFGLDFPLLEASAEAGVSCGPAGSSFSS